jgi:hypothetical protein
MLGDGENQLVAAAAQPFVVRRAGRQVGDHGGRFLALGKALVALVQGEEIVDIAAAAEAARGRRERHLSYW